MDLAPRIVARADYGILYRQACCNALHAGGDGITPQDLLANPFPMGLSRGLFIQTGSDVTAVQRLRTTGHAQNFSYDLQFKLGQGSVLEVGYSGVLGRKLNLSGHMNVNPLSSSALYRALACSARARSSTRWNSVVTPPVRPHLLTRSI